MGGFLQGLFELFSRFRGKKMGGANESVLPSDKVAGAAPPGAGPNPGNVLAPDFVQAPLANVPPPPPLNLQGAGVPIQTQAIRQHMSGGQIHLHVDGPQPLKVAVPVAEWYVIMRHLRSLSPFTFVDSENKCVLFLRPYIHAGLFEVAIELSPIQVGARFGDMNAVTGKR
jgi:hypothetical protein